MGDIHEFAALLQAALRLKTQKQLAELLGVDETTIRRWKKNQGKHAQLRTAALRDIINGDRRPATSAEYRFTFIDLFAGIGGMRIPFEEIGGKCIFTSEWDENANRTYKANFQSDEHEITGDITKIIDVAQEIPDHDLLLAGFPCQPFSIAGVSKKNALGRPHGFECTTQGTLFFDVARIIQARKPRAFLLENVKNLRSHDGGNTYRVIMETLRKQLGYHVTARVIDAQHFVPQHRERIIIVGFRRDSGFDIEKIPLPQERHTLAEVLHPETGGEEDLDGGRYIDAAGKVHEKYRLSTKLWAYLRAYAEKHRAAGNGFGYGKVTPEGIARTLSARYYKDGSEILIDRRRANPRRLTPRECARLMGFPKRFKIPVSDTQAYRQFGNSVVVPVIRHVAGYMLPHILAARGETTAASTPQLPLFRALETA
jgi:DNA (cytosine-5)-methyltransferase 1